MFKKVESMPFTQILQIIKPKYVYLKIIPDTSIRNYNSSAIAKMVHHTQLKITQRIKWEERKLFYQTEIKCTYMMDIYKKEVNFYYIVPEQYVPLAKEKIREVWKRVTIEECQGVKPLSKDAIKYQLIYKNEDAFSLEVDKKNNDPLNHILNVLEIMQDGDRVTVLCNLFSHNQLGWVAEHDRSIEKHKKNHPIEKEIMDARVIFKYAISFLEFVLDAIMEAINDFFGNVKKESPFNLAELALTALNNEKKPSTATTKKRAEIILNAQIAIVSEANNKDRANTNAIAVCQAYKSVEGDNALNYRRFKQPINIEQRVYPIQTNKISISEAQNFIQIPGFELLNDHKVIRRVDTLETEVPEELQQGYIRLGNNVFRGKVTQAYTSADKHLGNLGLVILGPQGSGKSTFIANYAYDVYKARESAVIIDYIKYCELSETIKKVIPKDYILELDLSNYEQAQAFAYNEAFKKCDTLDERLELANMQTQLFISFINSVNPESELSSRMRRTLSAACNVVFIQENMSLRDVVECLMNHRKRQLFIDMIPEELKNEFQDDINNLLDMNEYDKKDKELVTGTKDSKIDFILDRINLLMEDIKLKRMFNKSPEKNINLAEEINKGKIILIKMPEDRFPSKFHKNILTTFYITKLWCAAQVGNFAKRCHVIVDEISQAPTSEKFLVDVLPQGRKFLVKFVFSAHYLSQIQTIKEALKASGASYMLLQGTDEQNYKEMANDLEPYLVTDLLNLKRFQSLNMIKYSKGYAKFITQLPPELK